MKNPFPELQALRRLRGLSRAEVARRAGVSEPTIAGAESGSARLATLLAIVEALDGMIFGPAPGEGIGPWLRRLRNDRGLPQYRAAQMAGLTIPTIAALEGGTGRLGSLQRLLAAYETDFCVCPAESAPERRYRLLTGDARALVKEIESSSIDAVITDPPYALRRISPAMALDMVSAWVRGDDAPTGTTTSYLRQHTTDEWDDDIPQPSLWCETLRVLKPGAHFVAFAAPRNAFLTAIALTIAGFELRDPVYWLHGAGMRGGRDVGRTLAMRALRARMPDQVAALPRRRFRAIIGAGRARAGLAIGNDEIAALLPETASDLDRLGGIRDGLRSGAETIIVARKPFDGTMSDNVARHGVGGVRVRDGRWRSHDGKERDPMNVIGDIEGEHLHFYAPKVRPTERNLFVPTGMSNDHPTVKPLELMRWLIRVFSPPDGIVLDPFAGSGTTGLACVHENRRFVGVEQEARYAVLARARIGNAVDHVGRHGVESDDHDDTIAQSELRADP